MESVLRIGNHPYSAPGRDDIATRLDFLKTMAAVESLDTRRSRLLNYFQYYEGKLGNAMEDYRLGMILSYSRKQKEELETLKKHAKSVLSQYYMPVTVEEVLRTRFGYLDRLSQELLNLASQTREL
jgi:hypothetical protein